MMVTKVISRRLHILKKARISRFFTLSPRAFYVALFGLNLLALATCDTAVRIDAAFRANPNLIGIAYIPAIETILGGAVVLLGGVLLIDYLEKR